VDSIWSALQCCRLRILVFIWRVPEEPQNELKWNSALSGPRCKLCTFRLRRNTVKSTFKTGNMSLCSGCVCYHLSRIFKLSGCYQKNMQNCMRREEKPTRCHWMLYCTNDTLNMFRALLCPSPGARDYMCVITAYGVQCLVACCRGSGAGQPAMRFGRGMLRVAQHPSSWIHSLLSWTWPPTTSNQTLHTIGGNNTHIVSSSRWWA
jgi:hypothetical protein